MVGYLLFLLVVYFLLGPAAVWWIVGLTVVLVLFLAGMANN